MDEAKDTRDGYFGKSKGGQQDEQISHQGVHNGNSDPHTDFHLFCD